MSGPSRHLESILAQAGVGQDPAWGSITTPVYQSVTFRSIGSEPRGEGYDYSRTLNPTRSALEDTLAKAEGGAGATAFGSGMAAILAVFHWGLNQGDHVVLTEDLYGGTFRILEDELRRFGVRFDLVPTSDLQAVSRAMRAETRMIFLETPANPLLQISDIQRLADLAHEHHARLVVDNTLMTFVRQRPFELGADLVVYSATKYLGGHNDVLAGAVISPDSATAERIAAIANTTGGVLGPWDAFLLLRGLKTLALRMQRQETNAHALAETLRSHPKVSRVYYPVFNETGWTIQQRQASGAGGMVSFVLKNEAWALDLRKRLRLIIPAVSLGGTESLITEPYSETHRELPEELRRKLGLLPGLLRLSAGIEDPQDLVEDLLQALEGLS